MVSVTTNESLRSTRYEAYELPIADGQTLETGFGRVIAVVMTPKASQSASIAYGYSLGTGDSASQVTFSVEATRTYGVVVFGLK